MNPSNSFHCDEVPPLAEHVRKADAIAANAARWSELRTQARAALTSAETSFVRTLDAPGAAALTAAEATLRSVQLAAAAVDQAGGPDVLRENALNTPEAFALLAAGFAKKFEAVSALKGAATAHIANTTAAALTSGEVTVENIVSAAGLDGSPSIRAAREIVESVELRFSETLTARNNADGRAKGQSVIRRSFGELFAILTTALPAVPTPAVEPSPAPAPGKRKGW